MHLSPLAGPLLGLGLVIYLLQGLRSSIAHVPGPWYSRWTSLVVTYKWLIGKRAQYVQELHDKYGPVVRVGPNEVDFNSVAGAKRIHSFTQPFVKGRMYQGLRASNGTDNIFTTRDMDVHAKYRRLLSTGLSEGYIKKIEPTIRARADLAVHKISIELKESGVADVMKWWIFFSNDVISELTFGESFCMLEQGKMNQYVHDIQDAANTGRLAIPFPTITRLLSQTPLVRFTKVYASVQRMGSYARESIARYEKIMNSEPDKAKVTMLTKVFNAAADKNEETMSFPELESIAEAYIIAGSDTTAHSLTYLTWAVCGNPSIKEKLAEEVAGLPETYNNDDLKALPYLNQVIHETLRLYAAVPALLPREVGTAGCEIDGYWMPGGTEVQTQAYSMHRNPTVFSNPEQFDPPRWENPTKDMKDAWMPFGGGARTCGGLHLALMEIRYATARFFRTFPNAKVSSKYGFTDDDMEQIIYFLMFPKNNRCLIEVS